MKDIEKREQINVEELRERIDELLRLVENGETVKIIDKGKVIAQLTPPNNIEQTDEQDDAIWEDLKRLSIKLSASWPKDISVADAIQDVRQKL